MVFKKHDWMNYGKKGSVIETTIKDEDGRRLDNFKCNNEKDWKRILFIIKDKYGFDFSSDKDSINAKKNIEQEKSWIDKDLDW